ncbi:ExeM/NucH family extracellular endonuclease [Aestuariibacter halophilus]|uniref:ExeM/NucH family extracellular endonuclease n=1 Tax=Fluctibacter halophilus TaxID=226011 RepID=A0ABS8G734_9ALTE|nr:ExeM/NucH family extracellular endonuclease [Aestuariibacter halophilus]MCC2616409.1 ExeM/NucH family extracellular endonuclease [Aestuariibacter halophilus]
MKFRVSALAALCCASFAHSVTATTLWTEDFESAALAGKGAVGIDATNVTVDMDGVTRWSIDISAASLTASSDFFQVSGGQMVAQDVDGEVVWLSEVIDISGKSGVAFSLQALENGDHEGTDYFHVSYAVDGGSFIDLINWDGKGSDTRTLVGDLPDDGDWIDATISQFVGTGSTLQIRVAMINNAGSEQMSLDNVLVFDGATDGGDAGGGDTGGDTGSLEGVCFNCPDLDKIKDASAFVDADYYAPVITEVTAGSSADIIKQRLTEVISTDHRVLSYSEVWTALTVSDQDPANSDNVILLYSGWSLPKLSNGSGTQSSNPDNWNREHVWPNSHGFSSQSFEAYTDAHHLRPTDISINGDRGNLDFDNSDNPLAEAPENRIDADSFEPRDAVKGDVARMMFYMDTRYEGAGSDVTPDLELVNTLTSTGEARLGRLCTLIAWHEADPVDGFEQNRNDALYEFQGNRNPFIDHPEWVSTLYDAATCDDAGGDTGGGDTGGGDTGGGDTGGDTVTSGAIFISEYVEGSSFNKALELFNPSGNDIDLAGGNYTLIRYANGNTSGSTINLSGTLPANGTFVIANPSADAAILAVAGQTSGTISHNGDDAYELYMDGQLVDSFGRVGEDPGSAWGSDSYSTVNNTLRRNPDIYAGDTISDDAFDPSLEWTGSSNNDFSDLGMHTVLPREIFISEYIEGSSLNKALELYNPSGTAIDLSAENYALGRFSNGGTSATLIALNGTIPANGVFVIANPSADPAILAVADQTSGNISHNGDDAYELYKDGTVIDSFGRVGEDPGSAWGSGDVSTANHTLVRKASVTEGDTDSSDAFDPAIEWDGYPSNTFDYIGSHAGGGDGGDGGDGGSELGSCSAEATFIHAVQGDADASPMVGQSVVVEGVVTAVFPAIGGFFMQEEDAQVDGNSATSEGIFVAYSNEVLPIAGDVVRVLGDVQESYGKTQLSAALAPLVCGSDAVATTPLVLPFASAEDAETLEGMLVEAASTLTVTDSYNLGRYGEVTLSSERLFIPTNQFAPGSAEAQALAASNALNRVLLDDGVNGSNPEPVIYPTGNLSASNTLRLGDQVSTLVGVMDYSFSNYRVIPVQAPTFVASNGRDATPDIARGNVTVASLNVLNLFNGDGQGGGFPTSRGADSVAEFERQLPKTVAAIIAMDADIVGLMEIENDGQGQFSTLRTLVDAINAELGDSVYDLVVTGEALGTDQIAVALLYKPATVSLEGDAIVNMDSVFNRPPLAQVFRLQNNATLTVVVNHFKSKGCGGASGDDADSGDGQSCYNATRVTQANTLSNWIATDGTLSRQQHVLIIGDLNAYAKEDPIAALEGAGYVNLIAQFGGAEAYSYAFGGEMGYLDHGLANQALADKAVDAGEWHINADEPRVLDYNVEYKSEQQVLDFYSADPFRMSDHDPMLASFELPRLGDFDGDDDVDNLDIRALMMAIARNQPVDISFDFNGDGVVDARDIRLMRDYCTRRACLTR